MELSQFQEKDDLVNWIYVEYVRRVHARIHELRLARDVTITQIKETTREIINESLDPVYKKYVLTLAHPLGGVTTSIQLDKDSVELCTVTSVVRYSLDIDVNVDGEYAYQRIVKTAKLPVSLKVDLWAFYHSLLKEDSVHINQISKLQRHLGNNYGLILNQIRACLTDISFEGTCGDVMNHPKINKLLTIT